MKNVDKKCYYIDLQRHSSIYRLFFIVLWFVLPKYNVIVYVLLFCLSSVNAESRKMQNSVWICQINKRTNRGGQKFFVINDSDTRPLWCLFIDFVCASACVYLCVCVCVCVCGCMSVCVCVCVCYSLYYDQYLWQVSLSGCYVTVKLVLVVYINEDCTQTVYHCHVSVVYTVTRDCSTYRPVTGCIHLLQVDNCIHLYTSNTCTHLCKYTWRAWLSVCTRNINE